MASAATGNFEGHGYRICSMDIPGPEETGGKIHPAPAGAGCTESHCLRTTGWSLTVAIPISGPRSASTLPAGTGSVLGNIMHPGTFSMLGVGVPFGITAKLTHPESHVVVISGDGAFLSGGLSVEAAFQENLAITVVIDNNGGP